nr:pectin acetylesterase 8-like [Ipomoea batatas]
MKLFIILITVVLAKGLSADFAPSPAPVGINGNDSLVNPTLVTVDEGAVCLAGNPAAYYYSKGFGRGSKNWIVYLRVADVMLVGAYPFEDHDDPRNFKNTITVKL